MGHGSWRGIGKREETSLEGDVGDDQLDRTPRVHPDAHRGRTAKAQAGGERGHSAAEDLAYRGKDDQPQRDEGRRGEHRRIEAQADGGEEDGAKKPTVTVLTLLRRSS